MATITRTTITGCIIILVYIAFSVLLLDEEITVLNNFLETKNLKMRNKRIPSSRRERTMDAERLLNEALDEGKFQKM